jgi:hypothetical protein
LLREQQAASREASGGDPPASEQRQGPDAAAHVPPEHAGRPFATETACRSCFPALSSSFLPPVGVAREVNLRLGPQVPRGPGIAPLQVAAASSHDDAAFLTRSLRL